MSISNEVKLEKLMKVVMKYKQRILSGDLKTTDPEYQQCIKNEIVITRRCLIRQFKKIDELYEIRRGYDNAYKYYEKINDAVNRAEIYIELCEVNDVIKKRLDAIANWGEILIDMLTANELEDHDVCQLLNINWKTFQNEKQKYIKDFGKDKHLLYSIISVCGPEYRDRKGRMKEVYDCPRYEMPVYWAINETIMREMRNNKEFKKATDEKFKQLSPGIKAYKVVKDLEGNIIKVVEDKGVENNG